MGSKVVASIGLFLTLNLVFISMVRSQIPTPAHAPAPASAVSGPPPKCPELEVCLTLLGIGPKNSECCPLINGIINLDTKVCICDMLKLNALLIRDRDVALRLILHSCNRNSTNEICD